MTDIRMANDGLTLCKYMPLMYFKDFLKRKSLALVNPELWPDKNDSEGIRIYKNKSNVVDLLATCLTHASETSHHWSTYGKEVGVRVIFFKRNLVDAIPVADGFRYGNTRYLTLNDFTKKANDISVGDIPFYKRSAYKDEKEFRILWCGDNGTEKIKYLPIPNNAISKIVFSASISDEDYNKFKNNIHDKFGAEVSVCKTTILRSKGWIKRINNLTL